MKQAKLKRHVCLTYLAEVFKDDTNVYSPLEITNLTMIWRMAQKYFANVGWFELTGKCTLSVDNWPIWLPGYTVYQFPVNLAQVDGGKVAVFVKSSLAVKDYTIIEFSYKELSGLREQFSCDRTSDLDQIILNTGWQQ